jgi:hypothetical protein
LAIQFKRVLLPLNETTVISRVASNPTKTCTSSDICIDQKGTKPLVALPQAEQFQAKMSGTSQYALFEYCHASNASDWLYADSFTLDGREPPSNTRGRPWATDVINKRSGAMEKWLCMLAWMKVVINAESDFENIHKREGGHYISAVILQSQSAIE